MVFQNAFSIHIFVVPRFFKNLLIYFFVLFIFSIQIFQVRSEFVCFTLHLEFLTNIKTSPAVGNVSQIKTQSRQGWLSRQRLLEHGALVYKVPCQRSASLNTNVWRRNSSSILTRPRYERDSNPSPPDHEVKALTPELSR